MTALRERVERLITLTYGRPESADVAAGVLFEVLTDLEELHRRTRYGVCTDCRDQRHPCPTLLLLRDALGPEIVGEPVEEVEDVA